jgi:hypothetical protein
VRLAGKTLPLVRRGNKCRDGGILDDEEDNGHGFGKLSRISQRSDKNGLASHSENVSRAAEGIVCIFPGECPSHALGRIRKAGCTMGINFRAGSACCAEIMPRTAS